MRLVAALLVLAVATPMAFCQTQFWADMDGAQETPSLVTPAGGYARLTLNPSGTLSYDVRTFTLFGTAAHIHAGAPGSPGPIVFPLSGGPSVWSGTTPVLTAAQRAVLQSEGYYVNVHTPPNPAGEVRGQIEARPRDFAANHDGTQEVPSNASAATGTGTFEIVAPGNEVVYSMSATGLSATAAHIHEGVVGVGGGIMKPLAGGPTIWGGTTSGLSDTEFSLIQNLASYANIHTAPFPGGEIRGQIIPEGHKYGDISNNTLSLDSTGAPMDFGTITVDVSGGVPGSLCLLLLALAPDASEVNLEPLWLDASTILPASVFFPLDAAGSISLPGALPDLPGSFDLYMQVLNDDITAPNGMYTVSNGLRVPLEDIL